MKKDIKIKKQYGIANKEILIDRSITGNARGLYVYLCARSGNKGKCNPTVSTICKDLGINEATFHKYKNELIDKKVIKVEKEKTKKYYRNNYILLKKQTKGNFGYVYLDILTDSRVSLKEKAIYGLFACISGTRFISYPLSKVVYYILGMCRDTYFSAMKNLRELGYIKTKQLHIQGRFANCNYYINGAKPNKEKTRYIFKFKKTTTTKNRKNKANESVISESDISESDISEYDMYRSIVEEQIEYEALKGKYKTNEKAIYILENIVDILNNTIFYGKSRDLVVEGRVMIGSIVKSVFEKLEFNNIKVVVENILNINYKIKNIKAYLKVALINSYYQEENKKYNKMRSY